MNLVLLGPVGSGKGTQAKMISDKFGLTHISTGDIFRKNIQEGTELGKKAEAFVKKGELVPEEIVIGLVLSKLQNETFENGFILDGFPRTLKQAQVLEENQINIDKAILIDLSEEKIIERLSSRRMCKECSNPTSLEWLVDGKCEKCGGEVYQRDDDKPEVIKNRLTTQGVPVDVVEFYRERHKLATIQSQETKEETFAMVEKELMEI